MLWAYLDDSGLRAKGGKNGPLVRYALGGGVATVDVWDALIPEWRSRLNDPSNPSKVEWFHYTEWKSAYLGHAKRGDQFYGWSQRQLLDLLTDLTKMISKKKVDYFCASVPAVQSKRQVRDSYKEVATQVINRADEIANRIHPSEQISFRFSKHPELAGVRIDEYFSKLKILSNRRADCLTGDPRAEAALQVADLVVNEMASSRFMRLSWGPRFRMPVITKMMQLLKQEPPYHHMIELHLHDEKDE
jgi:hypothetical protein